MHTPLTTPNPNPAFLQPEFHEETNRLTGTEIIPGNRLTLLPSGVSSYKMRWKLIESAEQSIHIVAFSMMRDDTSRKLRDLLLEKINQGVEVRMIFDDAVLLSTFSGGILRDLAKAGAGTIRYHKLFHGLFPKWKQGHPFKQWVTIFKTKVKRHFHEKYMVVDGREAILGGINWGNKYAFGGEDPKAWRDSDVYLQGPIVTEIQQQFLKDFIRYIIPEHKYSKAAPIKAALLKQNREKYLPLLDLAGDENVRYVAHKPYDDQALPLTQAFLQLIKESRHEIYWGCHGIRPPRLLAEALAAAALRGVQVHLITNSKEASKTLMMNGLLGWMYQESSSFFRYLIENGVHIYEWQKPGAFHSKNFVADEMIASVGSYNIASGSAFHHTESNIFAYGGDFPLAVKKQFEIDLKDCQEISLDQAKIVTNNDPYQRILDARNLLIDRSLLTDAVRNDLDAGRYK